MRGVLAVLLVLVVIAGLRGGALVGGAWRNAGDVLLNHAVVAESEGGKRSLAELAQARFERALRYRPEDETARKGVGLALGLQGERARAVAALRAGGESGSRNLRLLGDWARDGNRREAAVFWYGQATEAWPGDVLAWHSMGQIYDEQREWEKARDAYRSAWQLDMGRSARPLARVLEELGQYEREEEMLRETLANVPSHHDRWWWWQTLGENLVAQKRFGEAIDVYDEALVEFPEEAWLHIGLAWATYERDGNATAALNVLERARALDGRGQVEFNIAELLRRDGRHEEADRWYQRAIASNPDGQWWYLQRANNARAAGNFERAFALYQETVEHFPSYANAYYEWASAYQTAEQSAEAKEKIETGIELMRQPHERYYLLAAEIYASSGEQERAIEAYERALAIDPDNEMAIRGLEQLEQDE